VVLAGEAERREGGGEKRKERETERAGRLAR
jgi:hypothetical protein